MKFKKIVYVGLAVDIIHQGHINILKTANKFGDVIVGLLTDEAISSYANIPYLNYETRKIIVQNIRYVKKVMPQNTLSYIPNLNLIKPEYIYISHLHYDHFDKKILKKYKYKKTKIIIKKFKDSRLKNNLNKIGYKNIIQLEAWESYNLKDIEVTMVPCDTSN